MFLPGGSKNRNEKYKFEKKNWLIHFSVILTKKHQVGENYIVRIPNLDLKANPLSDLIGGTLLLSCGFGKNFGSSSVRLR